MAWSYLEKLLGFDSIFTLVILGGFHIYGHPMGQILCRLYKIPLDETINWGLPMGIRMRKDHIKDPVVHGSLMDYGNTTINPACTKTVSLQNFEVGHETQEYERKEEEPAQLNTQLLPATYIDWNKFILL